MDYDLSRMKVELARRVEAYLQRRTTLDSLKRYAWEQAEAWEAVNDGELPPVTEDDRIYWAAIWDIINAGDEPPQYHPSAEELQFDLACLRGEASLPPMIRASRPGRGRT
jgi:hypothetical protein